jgi:hypothetical protein
MRFDLRYISARSSDDVGRAEMVTIEMDKARLRARQDTYLTNHYVGLHNMVVSVALAVAGVAAASLLGLPPAFRAFESLLWMMLVASMLAVTVAYAGTVTGAPFLPAQIPALPDLVLPLMLAVTEFFLFAVLAHLVNVLNTPQTMIAAWYLASVGFGTFSSLSVVRARRIIKRGRYSSDLNGAICEYTRSLVIDGIAAAVTAATGLLPILTLSPDRERPVALDYLVASALIVMYCAGLFSHGKARKILMSALQ